LSHFEGVGINVSYHQETQVFVNTALVNQIKFFMTLYQGRNNRIHDCHVFTKYNTIINACKDDAVFSKEDTFIIMLKSNTMRILQIWDPSVGILREEHLHHRSSCLGAGILWQQDSTAIVIHCKVDGNMKLTIEDHGVVLACNQVLVDSALTAAYTPHGIAYNVLHKSSVGATYPQGPPPFHPTIYVASANYAWNFLQDTRGED